jgi:S1-C subfamily serine protease
MIAEYEPGDRVRVGFERAGKTMEVEVVLGAVPVR